MKTYGYCRISTGKQNIERQIRNIRDEYPEAMIVEEIYTGTKMEGREKWLKLIKNVREGDRIVFDSVSRIINIFVIFARSSFLRYRFS